LFLEPRGLPNVHTTSQVHSSTAPAPLFLCQLPELPLPLQPASPLGIGASRTGPGGSHWHAGSSFSNHIINSSFRIQFEGVQELSKFFVFAKYLFNFRSDREPTVCVGTQTSIQSHRHTGTHTSILAHKFINKAIHTQSCRHNHAGIKSKHTHTHCIILHRVGPVQTREGAGLLHATRKQQQLQPLLRKLQRLRQGGCNSIR
jgi:hypothetical protein